MLLSIMCHALAGVMSVHEVLVKAFDDSVENVPNAQRRSDQRLGCSGALERAPKPQDLDINAPIRDLFALHGLR